MKLTAIALDDEPAALKVIENYAALIPFLELQNTFVSVNETIAFLKANKVDCIFLDVQMPDMFGTDLAKILQGQIQIIFTTAFTEYAVQSYEVQALDYLLKPIEFERFLQAVNKAYSIKSKQNEGKSAIFVKEGYDWIQIKLNDILYIRSDTNYLFINLGSKNVITRMSMAEILNILPHDQFVRTHKSYIVSVNAIQKIERNQLILDKNIIPIGKQFEPNIALIILKSSK